MSQLRQFHLLHQRLAEIERAAGKGASTQVVFDKERGATKQVRITVVYSNRDGPLD
jgi:hypothetical protein